jgi:hypothetical protein
VARSSARLSVHVHRTKQDPGLLSPLWRLAPTWNALQQQAPGLFARGAQPHWILAKEEDGLKLGADDQ